MLRDGDPWFVGPDACRALGIGNSRQAVARLDSDDVSTADVIDSMGRSQATSIVSEAGLYELIFMSRKAEARAFKKWVTSEVLPAIRKTGRYAPNMPTTLTWDEVRAELAQGWALRLDAGDIQRTLKSAGVLKQTGAPKAPWRDRFWWTGSAWNVKSADVSSVVAKIVLTRRALDAHRIPRQALPQSAQLEIDIAGDQQ